MNPCELMTYLSSRGVRLRVHEDRLQYSGADDEARVLIRDNAPLLKAMLDARGVASEVLGELWRCGFLLAEVNGRRVVISLAGIRDGSRMTDEQRLACREIGDMLAGALPEPGAPCPICGGRSFIIGADLTRQCGNCTEAVGD